MEDFSIGENCGLGVEDLYVSRKELVLGLKTFAGREEGQKTREVLKGTFMMEGWK